MVTLHSGGLDSLAGQTEVLARSDIAVMPVTVITNARVSVRARKVVEAVSLKRVAGHHPVRWTCIHAGISSVGRPRDDREPSQRLRGLLFLAAGVAASAIGGGHQLTVCENGVGAINLPMTPDHWVAHAAKAMHPRTLSLFATLASHILNKPFVIENLGLLVTKGELVRRIMAGPFAEAARETISCDLATYLLPGEACGKCTSCILRRIALVSANAEQAIDGKVNYQSDWFDAGTSWVGKQLIHLMAMRHQVEQIRAAISGADAFADLDRAFPALFDVALSASELGMARSELQQRLVHLYQEHVREFDAFAARIDRPYWGRRALVTELPCAPEAMAVG